MLAILSDPSVRRLGAARLLSMGSAEGVFFVGIWGRAAYEMDADAGGLAILMLGFAIGGMAGGFVAGPLVDRLGPRPVLVVAEVAMIPAALLLLLPTDLVGLTMVATLWAAVGLVAHTAMGAAAPFLVAGEEQLSRANAAIELTGILAFVVGPAAAALTVRLVDINAVFVVDAVTSAVAAVVLLGLPHRATPLIGSGPPSEGAPEKVGMWRVMREALTDPRLRFLLLSGVVVYLSFGFFGALEPLFFRDILEAGPEALGWVNSIVGLGLLAGTLAVSRLGARLRRELPVLCLVVGSGFGAVLYTITDLMWVVIVAAVLWGAVLGALLPTLRTMVQLASPPSRIGRMSTLITLSETIGDLFPLLLAPTIAAMAGLQPTLVGSGAMVLVLAGLLWPSARRLHQQRRSLSTAAAPSHFDATALPATPPGPVHQ